MSGKKYMGKYSKKQMSIILAMIFGDSWVSKFKPKIANSFLGCRHSHKQESYLNYKRNKLNALGFNVSKVYDTTNKYGKTFTFECRDPELFNQLRLVLYPKNNKTIKRKWLNFLDAEGIAIWFMDDGSYTKDRKNGRAFLYTNSFSKKENELIIKYFKKVWNIKPHLRIDKRNNKLKTFFLAFNIEETKKLFEIIIPYIIPDMMYKVGFDRKEQPKKVDDTV